MKTSRLLPIAAASLVALVLSVVGTSCSAVDPQALSVGGWSMSQSDFQSDLQSFYDVYSANSGASALKSDDGRSWATSYTSAFLNDQLSLRLAILGVEQRGLTVTDADRASAKTQLEKNFSNGSASAFGDLPLRYQNALIDGVAAQSVLLDAVLADSTTDEGLRRLYEATKSDYEGELVCASHILVVAGSGNGSATDAQYATALASAQAIRAQITSPADFAAVAKAKSQDTGSAPDGGVLDCGPKGTFVSGFDEAAWSQPVGVVGEPVKTKFGYHVILVSKRGVLTFEDLKSTLKSQVLANPETLLSAELIRVAGSTDISVDGRYGRYIERTARIEAPAGAASPSTTLATDVADMLSGATSK